MATSRDGRLWHRLSRQSKFVANGSVGSWNFGLVAPAAMRPLEKDGRAYQLLRRLSAPQFYLWTAHGPRPATATGLAKRFADRHIETWPHWRTFGSWPALADHLNAGSFTVAVMRYRRDGWFGLSPVGGQGHVARRADSAPHHHEAR